MTYPIRSAPDGDTAWGNDYRAVVAGVNDHQTRVTALEASAYTDEKAQDAAAALFTGGTHTGISFVYDDANNKINATTSGGGGSAANTITGVFNVKLDYGATGDGVTNDRTAIQNAINACQTAGGGTVYFPSGYYKVGNGLTVTASNVLLRGAGRGNTKLEKTGAFTLLQFTGTAGAGHITNSGVRDMSLRGGDQTGTLLDVLYGTRLYFQDLHLFGNPDIGIDTVEVWDSRFTNVYVEWCGGTTSAAPAVYVRSARTTTGTGSSTDSTNQIVFVGCLVETWAGGAIRVAGGGNSGYIYSIHFYATKIETGRVRGSAIVIDSDAHNVSFVDTYIYMDAFDTGYSTPIPAIDTSGSGSIRFDSCYIGVGSAVLTKGISAAGSGTLLNNIEGNYDLGAPTSGNHIDISGSGFSVGHISASNATTLVNGASTSVQANPGVAIRAVAGPVSNASFNGSPPVGTMAVDITNGRLYVKTASATWRYTTLT